MKTMSTTSLILALVALTLVATTVASADTFEVETGIDLPDTVPGDGFCFAQVGMFGLCTLRAAVEESNALSGPDTIVLDEGIFTLEETGGRLVIEEDLTITGAGVWLSVITTDQGSFRIFDVESGADLSISHMALRGARVTSVSPGGSWGAALKSLAGSIVLVNHVWFDQNSASGGCGALGTRGRVTITNSAFSHNTVPSNEGGGALCLGSGAEVSVINSTFYDNSAAGGGAISAVNVDSVLTLISSTLVDNIDTSSLGESPSIHLGLGSLLHLDKNLIRPSRCYYWDMNAVTSFGGNAVGPGNGCVLPASADQVNLTWQEFDLGSFGNYGGPIPTMLPGIDSLAVDPPPTSVPVCNGADARGEPRVGFCDVGAAERQPDDPDSGPLFVDGFEIGDTSAWQ